MVIVSFFKNFIINLAYKIDTKKTKRQNGVILFGAWFGNRYADNPRFLYEWLSNNKECLGLSHVVWVSKSQQIVDELRKKEFEAYTIDTKESIHYHKISQIQFICVSPREDILPGYSNGAVKVNLWHGLGGIKGVDFASKEYMDHPLITGVKKYILRHTLLRRLFMHPGGWGNCLYLSTTPYETSILRKYFARYDDCFIETDLPRNCECIELMPAEQKVIEQLSNWNSFILYLPTFRDNSEQYVDPLSDDRLKDFLRKNNILWVEKQHSYSKNDFDVVQGDNVLKLDPDFDISVILKKASIVITDYSSVCWDALYNEIPVIFYTPDFDYYVNSDRGLVMKPKDFLFGPRADTPEQLLDVLELHNGRYADMLPENQKKIFKKMWGSKKDYSEIWKDITNFIKTHPKGGI